MLQLSRGRGGRKADLQALAQQWGSKVVTLEELLSELKRLKPLPSTATADSSDTSTCGRGSRGLSILYIKTVVHFDFLSQGLIQYFCVRFCFHVHPWRSPRCIYSGTSEIVTLLGGEGPL